MYNMRYIETGENNAAFNMGLDESILESVAAKKSLPTLRLFAWKPAAVSIGYFQNVSEEIDINYCKTAGIDIVRRLTGGGAVFHAEEITYSFIIPESHPFVAGDIKDSYKAICSGLIAGLDAMGIKADFIELNDVCVLGKKISGNAQTRKKGVLLQHGTILLNTDVDKMFNILKVPNEKLKGKAISDVKARVTSCSDVLSRNMLYHDSVEAFARGFILSLEQHGFQFDNSVGAVFKPQAPSDDEINNARLLAKERFANETWIFKR